MSSLTFEPIGYISSNQKEPYQAPRQPDTLSEPAILSLNKKCNFEQALTDLEGCSHIWIIFTFHKNYHWKPLVQTPRGDKKVGVFATRAPYRPNPLGLTVVKLEKVVGLDLYLGANDLLDGTPVLDIKPYHPEADIINDAQINWLDREVQTPFKIQFSPLAEADIAFLEDHGLNELRPFILRQLEYDPTNHHKKRVQISENKTFWTLAYRTWRIDFLITDEVASVLSIYSGYTEADLQNTEDKYSDKALHKIFNARF